MAETASTRKVQITVPVADVSVIEWLDAQYSTAESIRRLIRESVAREGFVDVANRPVTPPAHPAAVTPDVPLDRSAAPDVPLDRSIPDVADDPADETEVDPEPAAKKTRRPTAAATAASNTIDDLLGL
ncbi:hypothetical protein [Microbacterium sp. G2-8]|uniref:hypothetical protein n=1 Tax=Microbacterium sp. G2-8 TaxID=2842454 RepID=UPI001C8AF513|nr:hypothetical protein [Microbacterium sp. G2-8]